MLLRYFYDQKLAHASYLVGCQRTGEALVVDPGRDIEPYLATAEQEGMRITGAAETHIHADYVSGARELADRVGATLYLSDEGDEDWKYAFADQVDTQLVTDGDRFKVGNIQFEVMHTPGHTPESISFLLTDLGGGATRPMGIFTGDFVFVGATGRPDLLEKAVGVTGNAEAGARQMFRSLERFKQLPDYLQVWPAHGAGSACGKGLGAIPSSTVGYEKLFNPALQFEDEEAFIAYLLEDQPEVPPYFKVMKRVNKEGPELLAGRPGSPRLAVDSLHEIVAGGAQVVDTRGKEAFAAGHVPGTINIPLESLAQWGGWLIDYARPLYLISDEGRRDEAIRVLNKIGVINIAGTFDATEIAERALDTGHYERRDATELADAILEGEVTLIDVRAATEWAEGRLPNARHQFLGTLAEHADELIDGKPIAVQCRSGARSAIGASILKAAGADRVINVEGGYNAWRAAGLPVVGAEEEQYA